MKLLVATGNPGKRRELEDLLGDLPVEILSPADFSEAPDVVEDGSTLAENAAKKASESARACGVHAVADDSGLFVDALGGAPGVWSARYAGPDPTPAKLCRKLLDEMREVAPGRRGAHFRCSIAMADPDGRIVLTASGRCDGAIGAEMRGRGGFGYDPVFVPAGERQTFAQMSPERKNALSHRGRALREFRRRLTGLLEGGGPPGAR